MCIGLVCLRICIDVYTRMCVYMCFLSAVSLLIRIVRHYHGLLRHQEPPTRLHKDLAWPYKDFRRLIKSFSSLISPFLRLSWSSWKGFPYDPLVRGTPMVPSDRVPLRSPRKGSTCPLGPLGPLGPHAHLAHWAHSPSGRPTWPTWASGQVDLKTPVSRYVVLISVRVATGE